VRVIAGKFRRRNLHGPEARALWLRPTSDRLRETLFNVLGPGIEDSLFVDVCAGTGAMGIEALSRGAREAVFIESDSRSAKLVRQNLDALGIRTGAQLLESDALAGLKKLSARRALADFVYLDPPYDDVQQHLRVLEYLDESRLIAPRGLVLVEHFWKTPLPERFDRLERSRLMKQGETAVSFYCLAAAA